MYLGSIGTDDRHVRKARMQKHSTQGMYLGSIGTDDRHIRKARMQRHSTRGMYLGSIGTDDRHIRKARMQRHSTRGMYLGSIGTDDRHIRKAPICLDEQTDKQEDKHRQTNTDRQTNKQTNERDGLGQEREQLTQELQGTQTTLKDVEASLNSKVKVSERGGYEGKSLAAEMELGRELLCLSTQSKSAWILLTIKKNLLTTKVHFGSTMHPDWGVALPSVQTDAAPIPELCIKLPNDLFQTSLHHTTLSCRAMSCAHDFVLPSSHHNLMFHYTARAFFT
eukprot:1161639-Pelagomonas_calceolata.AAC.3